MKALKVIGVLLLAVIVAAAAFYAWASSKTARMLAETHEAHTVDFPIPFPLSAEEIATLRIGADSAEVMARARAIERGAHLVSARYPCRECHGQDFSGGVMVDDPMLGRIRGPNLTGGAGGRTPNFTPADWDRIVRHAILPGGKPAAMPSEDFQRMSDQELSDIIMFIRAQPPVDNVVTPVTLGPLGKVLIATRQLPLSVTLIASHDTPHLAVPPPTAVTVEFGGHLAAVCQGCHGPDLAGGPIPAAEPSWPPAANLTPDATGLAGWTYEQFVTALHDLTRPDGTAIRVPMTFVQPFARNMTDVELQALWMYLQSLPAVPSD